MARVDKRLYRQNDASLFTWLRAAAAAAAADPATPHFRNTCVRQTGDDRWPVCQNYDKRWRCNKSVGVTFLHSTEYHRPHKMLLLAEGKAYI